MKKKIFILVMLIAFAVSVYGQNISDFDYTENRGTITITFYRGTVSDIRIPETINGKSVVAIGQQAFAGTLDFAWNEPGSGLTSVIIPGSVKTIGKRAFCGNKLNSVTLSNGVTTIGESAFSGCGLTRITIPESVTTIGENAFAFNKLTSIIIPNGVTRIERSAFNSNRLKSVIISDSVTYIGNVAFADNRETTTITIGRGVKTLYIATFAGNQLTSITIGANVEFLWLQEKEDDFGSGLVFDDCDWNYGGQNGRRYFESGFETAYNNGGKKAGTYTRPNTNSKTWTKQ